MFWFLMGISVFGYALQTTLMARHVRALDPLSVGFYRNLTLGISMAPLLFFVPREAWLAIPQFWIEITVAALLAAFSQWTRFLSQRALPVGISSAAVNGFNVFLAFLFSGFYFAEWLSLGQVLLVVVIVSGSLALSIGRSPQMRHLENVQWWQGLGLIVLTSVSLTAAFTLITKISRDFNPLLTGYLWEILIAVCSIFILGGRWLFTGEKLVKVSFLQFWTILRDASPTALGTAGFLLAVTMAPFALASGVSVMSIVFTTLFCAWCYHEKLYFWQYLVIGITVLAVMVLRLLS